VQKSVELEEKTLHIQRRVLDEKHPETLRSMDNLADYYSKLGQVQKAMKLEEKTLKIQRRVLSEEHPDTFCSMAHFAYYNELRQMQKTVELEERTLQMKRRVLGEEQHDTLRSFCNLASHYYKLSHVEEAIRLCDKGLKISMQALSKQHSQTVEFLKDLADYCQDSASSHL